MCPAPCGIGPECRCGSPDILRARIAAAKLLDAGRGMKTDAEVLGADRRLGCRHSTVGAIARSRPPSAGKSGWCRSPRDRRLWRKCDANRRIIGLVSRSDVFTLPMTHARTIQTDELLCAMRVLKWAAAYVHDPDGFIHEVRGMVGLRELSQTRIPNASAYSPETKPPAPAT